MKNWCLLLIIFCSCEQENSSSVKKMKELVCHSDTAISFADTVIAEAIPDTSELEYVLIAKGLVNVASVDSSIQVDLKYSTNENFMKEDMYGDLGRVYLHPEVAAKLARAQKILKKKHPSYSLLVYDGVRPLSIQRRMWDESDIPLAERGKFLSNPANGSLHNYGAAVDLTICDSLGRALDMGSAYDDPEEISFPSLEQKLLKEGKLTNEQIANRQLLRSVMWQAGFTGIQSEWWHFNSLTRAEAKQRYQLIE